MEKKYLDRRLEQMKREGTVFRAGVDVGAAMTGRQLRDRYDAVVLAVGSTVARDLPAPGRELKGIHQAMDFLPQANRVALGDEVEGQITATDKHVVIIGGGDTGADCLGTSHRQGAKSVTQLEIMPQPGEERPENQPWPTYPMTYRVSSAHVEGGERVYSVSTKEFLGDGDGNVRALRMVEVEMRDGRFQEVEARRLCRRAGLRRPRRARQQCRHLHPGLGRSARRGRLGSHHGRRSQIGVPRLPGGLAGARPLGTGCDRQHVLDIRPDRRAQYGGL
jgi:NADPH-dependent glutamate synthase beta subunit-like oxidoreductase